VLEVTFLNVINNFTTMKLLNKAHGWDVFFALNLFVLYALMFAMPASAATKVTKITVDGGSNVTVHAQELFEVALTVDREEDGVDKWGSTRYNINGSGISGCQSFPEPNLTTGTGETTETFSLNAPTAIGTFDLVFQLYEEDGCSVPTGEGGTLANAVTVQKTPSEITIFKKTTDPSGTELIFDFQSGFGLFSVQGDNTNSYTYNPTSFDGSFHIDEAMNQNGWVLDSVDCVGEGKTSLKYEENSTKLTGVYITPVQNTTTACTFTNSLVVPGCMDETAINYDDLATVSDDSCVYSNPSGDDDDDDQTETEYPWCSFEGAVIDATPDTEALTNGDVQVADERRNIEAVETIAPYANFGGKEGNDWQVDPLDFYSLGIGGFVTYEFSTAVAFDQDGTDIAIYEITGGNTAEQTEESILVEVSQNGSDWVSLGSFIGDAEIDISPAGLEYVKFVRLTDESQEVQGTNGDGYDLDGIVILQGSCGDEPVQEGGGALRGGGGGGSLLNPTNDDDEDTEDEDANNEAEDEDDNTPEGQTQGDSDTRSDDTSSTKDTEKPEGEVQGDQVSVVPVGAPNAGGGGMTPTSSTSSIPLYALFGMILGAVMLRIKPVNE